ncbi:MAG: ATP-binding cassette domain-containing protein [Lachnospiraceae bacterium]|nr:ATP-binding cassette domain-containing protein [Lachnospiraceae bacterium]
MKPIIQINNLGKTFVSKSGDVKALDCINLEIFPGEIFGIIGLSGAGKSTLVRCINFLERPTSGTVQIDGLDLGSLSSNELNIARRNMGMIFQQFNLLMQRTALDNVCFPLELSGVSKRKARERAKELLEIVGLNDKLKAYPSQLSGGQKQRVAIARALATKPNILLCDEATSALDPTTTTATLDLLKKLNQEMRLTIIIITHEMSVVEKVCNRVAIIDDSNICEMGSVNDIFANPKSEAAKRLVFHKKEHDIPFTSKNCYRIIFDGRSSFEPVIANVVLECKAPINIMYADTRNIDGNAVGQMVIQLPDEELAAKRILHYLNNKKIPFEEVKNFV